VDELSRLSVEDLWRTAIGQTSNGESVHIDIGIRDQAALTAMEKLSREGNHASIIRTVLSLRNYLSSHTLQTAERIVNVANATLLARRLVAEEDVTMLLSISNYTDVIRQVFPNLSAEIRRIAYEETKVLGLQLIDIYTSKEDYKTVLSMVLSNWPPEVRETGARVIRDKEKAVIGQLQLSEHRDQSLLEQIVGSSSLPGLIRNAAMQRLESLESASEQVIPNTVPAKVGQSDPYFWMTIKPGELYKRARDVRPFHTATSKAHGTRKFARALARV